MNNPPQSNEIEVSLFGPGYGESIAIHLGNNEWIIVDSCRFRSSNNPSVIDYFDKAGIEPDVKIICASHWHDDHIKGISNLVDRYPDARLVISSALVDEKFTKIITDSPLSKERKAVKNSLSGVNELKNVYDILRNNKNKPILASINKSIYSNNKNECEIRAISPNDSVTIESTVNLIDKAIKDNPYSGSISSIKPNDISVVLEISFKNKFSILLGADLESKGWDLVIQNIHNINKSEVYKVSHHGSISGDHEKIWSKALKDSPISIIAPFNKGSKLPNSEDLNRILNKSENVFITSSHDRLAKNYSDDKLVNRSLKEKNAKYLESEYGQIRLKKSLNSASDWGVEVFGTAFEVTEEYLKNSA